MSPFPNAQEISLNNDFLSRLQEGISLNMPAENRIS